jgi:hypothetical protein
MQIFFEVFEKLRDENFMKELKKLKKLCMKFGDEKEDGKMYRETKEYYNKIANKKEIIYLKKFENNKKYDLKSIKENAPFLTNLVKNGLSLILSEKNPDIKVYFDQFKNMEKYIEQKGEDELKLFINKAYLFHSL